MLIPISRKQTIYSLVKENKGFDDVLYAIGFTDIKHPIMLNTVGKFMTIEKACSSKKLSIEYIQSQLQLYGYALTN